MEDQFRKIGKMLDNIELCGMREEGEKEGEKERERDKARRE